MRWEELAKYLMRVSSLRKDFFLQGPPGDALLRKLADMIVLLMMIKGFYFILCTNHYNPNSDHAFLSLHIGIQSKKTIFQE